MALTLLKRGSIWYIRGATCGRLIYKSTKLTDRNLANALRKRIQREILEEHVHGAKRAKTFAEAVSSYLSDGGPCRFIDPLKVRFGTTKLRDITQPDLDMAAGELYPHTLPETRNRQFYTPFIAVWNYAVGNDWATPRKWRRPRKPKGTNVVGLAPVRSGTSPVDYERAAEFVAAMSPAPGMLMTFLFYTGLRPIEAFALRAEDVTVDKQWFVVRSSKTGQPRGVPLHSFLCGWLGPLVERGRSLEDGILFRTQRNKPYGAVQFGGGGVKTAITLNRKRTGINDVSPYTARHTVSTGLVIAGVHPHIKDQILGHAADDMSRHYTNVPQAPLIEAINKLPVPALWRDLPWWQDPLAWSGKLLKWGRN